MIYDKLTSLGIVLPNLPPPVAKFVPTVRSGNLIFVSGHISKRCGKLGDDVTVAEGQQAAREVAIDLIARLHTVSGDLTKISRIVKLLVLVNATPAFTEAHLVANGASELIGEVFGDAGAHARSAFGVAQIPFGACVEIELIAELRS
ncbi:MAG TPA: RidA family protein [Thermoanaerobaculia bacterium]|nr:RidA family protein [Thermoanaerobaculia bacterium]